MDLLKEHYFLLDSEWRKAAKPPLNKNDHYQSEWENTMKTIDKNLEAYKEQEKAERNRGVNEDLCKDCGKWKFSCICGNGHY